MIMADNGVSCCTFVVRHTSGGWENVVCGETLGAIVLECLDGGDGRILRPHRLMPNKCFWEELDQGNEQTQNVKFDIRHQPM